MCRGRGIAAGKPSWRKQYKVITVRLSKICPKTFDEGPCEQRKRKIIHPKLKKNIDSHVRRNKKDSGRCYREIKTVLFGGDKHKGKVCPWA